MGTLRRWRGGEAGVAGALCCSVAAGMDTLGTHNHAPSLNHSDINA